jgi:four helix bundle protein
MAYNSFEDLEVWQLASRTAVWVYELIRESRDFGLKDQMIRAAVSIPSNIAEGAERDSKIEFARFLYIAKGFAAELRTQVYIARQVHLIPEVAALKLTDDLKIISAMLHNLIKTLKPPDAPTKIYHLAHDLREPKT